MDLVSGKAQPVPNVKRVWANLHKASGISVERRGPPEQQRPADPEGGIAPRWTCTVRMGTGG